MPKEVAKALLIHSSTNWASNHTNLFIIGHGIVPKHINDIITTPNDEILFYIYDNAIEYETWNYNLPVPINNNSHPFIAKATLVYTPKCDRLQGVDYTCTELDLKFGRLKPDGSLSDIKENKQDILGFRTLEDDARKMFRKMG